MLMVQDRLPVIGAVAITGTEIEDVAIQPSGPFALSRLSGQLAMEAAQLGNAGGDKGAVLGQALREVGPDRTGIGLPPYRFLVGSQIPFLLGRPGNTSLIGGVGLAFKLGGDGGGGQRRDNKPRLAKHQQGTRQNKAAHHGLRFGKHPQP